MPPSSAFLTWKGLKVSHVSPEDWFHQETACSPSFPTSPPTPPILPISPLPTILIKWELPQLYGPILQMGTPKITELKFKSRYISENCLQRKSDFKSTKTRKSIIVYQRVPAKILQPIHAHQNRSKKFQNNMTFKFRTQPMLTKIPWRNFLLC